jgi:hypothetical protein
LVIAQDARRAGARRVALGRRAGRGARHRHHPDARRQSEYGVTVYEETATVRVDADLSLAGCGITNVRATSNNDRYLALLGAFAPRIRDAVRRYEQFCRGRGGVSAVLRSALEPSMSAPETMG